MSSTALAIGGTSCCCKSTILKHLSKLSKVCIYKNSADLGEYKKLKNSNPLAAISFVYSYLNELENQKPCLLDRTPMDNEIYRIIYYLMIQEEKYGNDVDLISALLAYFNAYHLHSIFNILSKKVNCIFLIDSNLPRLHRRMLERNSGSDQIRAYNESYLRIQNLVFSYIATLYQIPIYDFGAQQGDILNLEDFYNFLAKNGLWGEILENEIKYDKYFPQENDIINNIPEIEDWPKQPNLKYLPDWGYLSKFTNR